MSSRTSRPSGFGLVAAASAVAFLAAGVCLAGHGGVNRFPAVGGVSINADGVLAQPDVKVIPQLRKQYQDEFKPLPEALNQPVEIRQFSLRAAEEALSKSGKNVTYQMPDEIRFMAGIQRIQYVFIYPDDIVLAGPGEGWKVDENANHVGVTTGRPVLRLEDFIVALRTVDRAREEGISVSIDPTAEGRQRFEQYMSKQKTFNPAVLDGIEKALGPQQITITGVPETTRFARILAASDYKMKRIAMGLDESPLAELPSFLNLMVKDKVKLDNMMPRWWMACNYEPIGKSEDGLAFEIRGQGVKVQTEDEVIGADGSVTGTGKANPVAEKWAKLMTEHFEGLADKEPVFGELRNLMDMCVVAALISKENMLAKAKLEVPTMKGDNGKVELVYWHAPKTVATECSAIKRGREFIITASGGVDIASWEVASKTKVDPKVAKVRQDATAKPAEGLWWN